MDRDGLIVKLDGIRAALECISEAAHSGLNSGSVALAVGLVADSVEALIGDVAG